MDLRQYWHTWVSGMTEAVSPEGWTMCWAIWEMISGGNLLTGRDAFRKEDRNLRMSRVLVSRLSI